MQKAVPALDPSAPGVPDYGRAIVADEVVKEFETEIGTRRVLDGISFRVGMGERMAILGRNGAGKSTLIQILSGLQLPTTGVIHRGLKMSWPLALGGGFEGPEHDMSIDEASLSVMKRAGQRADNVKAKLLPEAHGWLVRGDHEVELHGAETEPASFGEAVLAHTSAGAETASGRRNHERSVGDMTATRWLIGLEDVGADDASVALGHVGVGAGAEPVRQRLLAGHVRGKDVGIAGSDDRAENAPDGILICLIGLAYVHEHARSTINDPGSATRLLRASVLSILWRSGFAVIAS